MFSTKSTETVILSSCNALMVVHVLELAIRVFTRTGLCQDSKLSCCEKHAMAGVTHASTPSDVGPYTTLVLSMVNDDAEMNEVKTKILTTPIPIHCLPSNCLVHREVVLQARRRSRRSIDFTRQRYLFPLLNTRRKSRIKRLLLAR